VEKSSTSPPSPLSPTRWPKTAFSPGAVTKFVITLAIAFLLGQGLSAAIIILWHIPVFNSDKQLQLNAPVIVASFAGYVPLIAVIVTMLPRTAQRSFAELGLRLPRPADILYAILGTLAMILVASVAGALQKALFHIDGTAKDIALFNTSHDQGIVVAFVILAVVVAPLMEELVFRGFLFNALLRALPAGVAITIASALFGLAHGDLVASFPLACAGAILCYVYYRSGSLTASICTHGLFNLVNIALVMLGGAKHP
jgi:CAAX protease family protein